MRGTVSFLHRFWADQSGATPPEVVIVLAIAGTWLVGTLILVEGSIALAIDNL